MFYSKEEILLLSKVRGRNRHWSGTRGIVVSHLLPLAATVSVIVCFRIELRVKEVFGRVNSQLFGQCPEQIVAATIDLNSLDLTATWSIDQLGIDRNAINRLLSIVLVDLVTVEDIRIFHPEVSCTGSAGGCIRIGAGVGTSPVGGTVATIAVGLIGSAPVHIADDIVVAAVIAWAGTAGSERQGGEGDHPDKQDKHRDAGRNRVLVRGNLFALVEPFVVQHDAVSPCRFWRLRCRRWRRGS